MIWWKALQGLRLDRIVSNPSPGPAFYFFPQYAVSTTWSIVTNALPLLEEYLYVHLNINLEHFV